MSEVDRFKEANASFAERFDKGNLGDPAGATARGPDVRSTPVWIPRRSSGSRSATRT